MHLKSLVARVVLLACGWLSMALCSSTLLAQPTDIRLTIEQRSVDGVNATYGIRLDSPRLFFTALPGQLTAPDGTSFTRFNNSVSNLTFQQIGSRFFGNWSIAEPTFAGPSANHSFFMNGFALTDVFAETPTIVAPVPSGQSVVVSAGTPFQINWQYPSGTVPTGNAATSSGSGGQITFGTFGQNSISATATLNAGVSQANLSVAAGSNSSLASFLSGVTRDPSGLGNNWTVQGTFLTCRSRSQ